MKGSLETKLGVFFALSAVAAILLIELSGGVDVFKKSYQLHADFKSVKQLKVGDPVKMAGVPIGRVATFDFVEDKVRVTMKINDGRKVRTDAVAGIQASGLVGANFVAVSMGNAPNTFAADGVLETEEAPDLNVIMRKLDNVAGGIENLTKSFSGDSIQNVLGPMTDFLKQNNPKITAILGDMQVVSSNMLAGRGTLGKFMSDDSFYTESHSTMTNLNRTVTEARAILADAKGSLAKVTGTFDEARSIFGDLKLTLQGARETIDKVNGGQGSLGRLLSDEKLYSETTLAMTNLREIFEKINQGQGSAGALVNDPDLYKNAKMTLQKLDKATEGLEDTGPLSILGTAINNLF
jgi:phospholipid/cholesterol/gamma-HCH transport system substrate-binding protein